MVGRKCLFIFLDKQLNSMQGKQLMWRGFSRSLRYFNFSLAKIFEWAFLIGDIGFIYGFRLLTLLMCFRQTICMPNFIFCDSLFSYLFKFPFFCLKPSWFECACVISHWIQILVECRFCCFQAPAVLPWSRKIHVVMEGAITRSDKERVVDFFRHNKLDISPISSEQRAGFTLGFEDFMRSIELGKRQTRKKCVSTQVTEADLPGPENFDDLFVWIPQYLHFFTYFHELTCCLSVTSS